MVKLLYRALPRISIEWRLKSTDLRPRLTAREAAPQFGGWLRRYHPGCHSDRILDSLYMEFCEINRLEPTPKNNLRRLLREFPGIKRDYANRYRDGKRHRPKRWWVEPLKDCGGSGA